MRTLIPLLLLACLAYAGWYYWQAYTDTPLREKLLLAEARDMRQVTVHERAQEGSFQLRKTEEGDWVVNREYTQVRDQSSRVRSLIGKLAALRTDSTVANFDPRGSYRFSVASETYGEEVLSLTVAPDGLGLALVERTGDAFAVPAAAVSDILQHLRFEYYRERRLLRLAAERVDSVVVRYGDSLLWRMDPADLPTAAQAFLAPAAAPYADYFDEIAHQDRYHASIRLYDGDSAHVVTAYLDSLWPRPYVLVGQDFPRRYLAADSLR